MLIKQFTLTLTLTIVLLTFSAAMSQQYSGDMKISDKITETNIITEEMFTCFQHLQCLKDKNPFKNSNLDEIRLNGGSERYTVEGSSQNEELYAEYDRSGKLIHATLIQRNINIPKRIARILLDDEFKEWTMIGNEVVIEDFDTRQTQYKIVLQNGSDVKVEYIDHNGQILNRIS